ncbi:potassium transporter Kup [bacterium]|nr:potassium transporter Kup [bacterium]
MSDNNQKSKTTTWELTLGALGVVFGDIGTSPLYAMRECFSEAHGLSLTPSHVLGVLSLIIWSLIILISIKYVTFVMRADNQGEGGILALMALAKPRDHSTLTVGIIVMGLFGTALLFGDGVITPAISVLSAVEGLAIVTPVFEKYVIGITILILLFFFMSQRFGTARIGTVFGPIIILWYAVLGLLGIYGILKEPSVFLSFNPSYAIELALDDPAHAFFLLSSVFLVVTGGEALYADMGHFGRIPIKYGWFFFALPGLLLNYLGQGALLLHDPLSIKNPFYMLAPTWGLIPLVALATAATVIASQAIVSGVFSLTRQAIQLGYFPRVRVTHTSAEQIGQIYVPSINTALLVTTLWLVLTFRTSSALAGAYGVAVSLTMVLTTSMMFYVTRGVWKWSWVKSIVVILPILIIELLFLGANCLKIADGGWFPLVTGIVIFAMMTTWQRGRGILAERLREQTVPLDKFFSELPTRQISRVSGTAIFMTGSTSGIPPALVHNLRHNKVLHERVLFITVLFEQTPVIPFHERVSIQQLDHGFYRILARYGFMQKPSIENILSACLAHDLEVRTEEVTFFLGREILLATPRPGMAIWREKLFAFLQRNSQPATQYFKIPPNQVLEIGLQVEL